MKQRATTTPLTVSSEVNFTAPTIVARGLRKDYRSGTAVAGVDFEVHRAECFGLLGPNGAGKSTVMKMVCGLATVGGGTLSVFGRDMRGTVRDVKARTGVVPQDDNLDSDLTTEENLLMQCRYHGLPRAKGKARTTELLDFAGLIHRRDARIDELSGGMRRRLLIARALVARPQMVLLDEPSTGLDPHARDAVWGTLRTLRDAGVTLLLTTHYMQEALELCDRLAFMDRGLIVAQGTPEALMETHGHSDLEALFLSLTSRDRNQ